MKRKLSSERLDTGIAAETMVRNFLQASAATEKALRVGNRPSKAEADSTPRPLIRSSRQHIRDAVRAPGTMETSFRALTASADISEIKIAFEGQQTLYDWGGFASCVGTSPYAHYFNGAQSSSTIVEKGSDPAYPAAYNVGGKAGVWGFAAMRVTNIGYSHRFGGSFYAVLSPSEDCGIEARDLSKSIAVDLHQWLLHVYLRPSKLLFNQTATPQSGAVQALMHCELEVAEYEAYPISSQGHIVAGPVAQADVDALLREAENESVLRLEKLARFLFGFVHDANIPGFDPQFEQVNQIHVSNGMCNFELTNKVPMVQVMLQATYRVPSDGPYSDLELTATPSVTLLDAADETVFSRQVSKYLGNSADTGWMTVGFVDPTEFSRTVKGGILTSWKEADPLIDDEGWGWTSFAVPVDGPALQQRIASRSPGQVGQDIFAIFADQHVDLTTYSTILRFNLVWR